MSGATYKIGSIYEMADIPTDAMPRFLEELPAILAEIQKLKAIAASFDTAMAGSFKFNIERAGSPTWTDDGIHKGTLTVKVPGADDLIYPRWGEPS